MKQDKFKLERRLQIVKRINLWNKLQIEVLVPLSLDAFTSSTDAFVGIKQHFLLIQAKLNDFWYTEGQKIWKFYLSE